MNRVFVHGWGAVSPAGWGMPALREALLRNEPLPPAPVARPGGRRPLRARPVPPPDPRPPFLAHPRLRRSSTITQHALAAGLEALGDDLAAVQTGALRMRLVVCLMPGCVTYSRRFYEEILRDPATASPLLFPETVYNAPASHMAAFLNLEDAVSTLAGDDGTFLQGVGLAAGWLSAGQADGCLVVAAEEPDWIVADALQLFSRRLVHAGGAGALYLRAGIPGPGGVELERVTEPCSFTSLAQRPAAARAMRAQLPPCQAAELLCLGTQGVAVRDAAERAAWQDWTAARLEPKRLLGEAFTASAAWLCVAAADALRSGPFSATQVSVVGANQQAIGARLVVTP